MKILFVCTHNRCRSILAEAVTNHYGDGLISACSAGSSPAGQVHPLTLAALQRHGIATSGLSSKSWDDVEDAGADVVVTVCDSAAQETCPVWFGDAHRVHWGLRDPSAINRSDAEVVQAFDETIELLADRIRNLVRWVKAHPNDAGWKALMEGRQ